MAAAWESIREDVHIYGGFLHADLAYRANGEGSEWIGAEVIATAHLSPNTLLWDVRETAESILSVGEIFRVFPALRKVFQELNAVEIHTESALLGWYVVLPYFVHIRSSSLYLFHSRSLLLRIFFSFQDLNFFLSVFFCVSCFLFHYSLLYGLCSLLVT